MTQYFCLCVAGILLFGCPDPPRPDVLLHDTGVDATVDASADAESFVPDADLDIAADAETEPEQHTHCTLLESEQPDGTLVRGQFIYAYDHRFWWWEQENRTTVALFDSTAFAEFPDDKSFQFLPASDLADARELEPTEAERCYFDWIEEHELTLPRLPIGGESQILMANEGYHRHEDGYGDFAWDFVRTDESGARFANDGAAKEDYFVWNEPVYSPIAGYIAEVVNEGVDNPPGSYPEDAINNLVGIHLEGGFHLYILHFLQGSIPATIAVGTTVEKGDLLGYVGNSGVTLEPHLHISMLWWEPAAQRYWSVPTHFDQLLVADFPGTPTRLEESYAPQTGQLLMDP